MQWFKCHHNLFPSALTASAAGGLLRLLMLTERTGRVPKHKEQVREVSKRTLENIEKTLIEDETYLQVAANLCQGQPKVSTKLGQSHEQLDLNSIVTQLQLDIKSGATHTEVILMSLLTQQEFDDLLIQGRSELARKRKAKSRTKAKCHAGQDGDVTLQREEKREIIKDKREEKREESNDSSSPSNSITYFTEFMKHQVYDNYCELTNTKPKKSESTDLIQTKLKKIINDAEYGCTTNDQARDLLFEIHKCLVWKHEQNSSVNISIEKIYDKKYDSKFLEAFGMLRGNKFVKPKLEGFKKDDSLSAMKARLAKNNEQ